MKKQMCGKIMYMCLCMCARHKAGLADTGEAWSRIKECAVCFIKCSIYLVFSGSFKPHYRTVALL